MPLYPRKEFAEFLETSLNALAVYVQRKKIVVQKDGLINTEDPTNVVFLSKWKVSKSKKAAKEAPKQQLKIKSVEPGATGNDLFDQEQEKTEQTDSSQGLNKLTKEKLASENEKRNEEIALLKLKREKQSGLVIPTALVKHVFTASSKSQANNFHHAADALLTEFSKLKSLTVNEKAEMRKKLIDTINNFCELTVLEGIKSIEVIVEDYSSKKGVGERE